MVARAGERAWKSGEFHCRDCDHKIYVKQGDELPDCPCGRNVYDLRTNEPEKQEPRRYDENRR